MSTRHLQVLAIAFATVLSLSASAVQRTFVASFGSDANTAANCTFANPCRGFAAAQTVTDPNGEIIALDAAGYGAITITKSISLIANPGFYAGISVGAGNGITIATAGVKVILRGLNVNSVGGTGGVVMTNGTSLTIENCVFSGFTSAGGSAIKVATPAKVRIAHTVVRDNVDGILMEAGASADISSVKVYGNSDAGIFVNAQTATTTNAAVSDSIVADNFVGFGVITGVAGAIGRLSITRSSSTNNSFGVYALQSGAGTPMVAIQGSMFTHNSSVGVNNVGGTVESLGHNVARYNGSDTSGVITATPTF